ncbi:hypothetical protein [Nocardia gipuzkoensis]
MSNKGGVGPVVRRLPVDRQNAGPLTESWIRYEKQAVALMLIRELATDSHLEAIAPQHSSDVVLLHRTRRPTLVSVKHREPHQRSGDSGWGPSALRPVLAVLHRQWSQTEGSAVPAFWSNAGFVRKARILHANVIDKTPPSMPTLRWLADAIGGSAAEAAAFAGELEFLVDPLPGRLEIDASGAAAAAEFLERCGRHAARLFARECFEALCARIVELSEAVPPPPSVDTRAELVSRLLPDLDSEDAAALATRTLPVAEAEAIVLGAHDRRLAARMPDIGFGWEPDDRFIGRHQELAQLGKLLEPGGVAPVKPTVLRGMTGCGKTSIATQFAALHAEVLRPVFVSADSRAQVLAALHHLGAAAGDLSLNSIAEARTPVTASLPATTGMLLILDGVTDADTVRGLIPRAGLCRVLITTTIANLDTGYHELVLSSWQPAESRSFLAAQLPDEPTQQRDRLRERLHDHPLALNQAVDHCRVLRRCLTDYLARLAEAPSHILALGRASGHPVSIIESIGMNIEAVQTSAPESLTLLNILSFLGPAPVHESIFDAPINTAAVTGPDPVAEVATVRWRWRWRRRAAAADAEQTLIPRGRQIATMLRDKDFRDRAAENLARMSLLTVSAGHLVVHPLIALVARDRIAEPQPWLEAGLGLFMWQQSVALTDPIPAIDDNLSAATFITAAAFEQGFDGPAPVLLAAMLCVRLAPLQPHVPNAPAIDLGEHAGLVALGPKRPAAPQGWSAIELGEHATRAALAHARVIASSSWTLLAARTQLPLAVAYSLAGRIDNALEAIGRSLSWGRELEHPTLIIEAIAATHALVSAYRHHDRADVALSRLGTLVTTDTDFAVLMSVTHANLLHTLSRLDEAEACCERALELAHNYSEENGEPVEPELVIEAHITACALAGDRGDSMSSLASAMTVIELYRRPDIAPRIEPITIALALLAGAEAAVTADKLALARTLIDEALTLARDQGFDTIAMMQSGASTAAGRLAHAEGHLDQARADFEEAIAILEAMASPPPPQIAAPLHHLARVLHEQGERWEAITCLDRAYTLAYMRYGPAHPETRRVRTLRDSVTHTEDASVNAVALLSMYGLTPGGGGGAKLVDGDRTLIDTTKVLRNIRTAIVQLIAEPQLPFRIADFVSESELAGMFYGFQFGGMVISSTLKSVRDLLTAQYGTDRVARPLESAFDLAAVSGYEVTYGRAAHDLAVTLLNTTLVDGVVPEANSPLWDEHDDPEVLIATWMVVVFTFGWLNATLHAGH